MLRASFSSRLVQRVSSRAITTRITTVRRFNSRIPARSDWTPERRDRTRSSQFATPVEPLDTENRGSRTIRVGGAALKPNSTGYKKITAAFKGYGRIRDVRFGTHLYIVLTIPLTHVYDQSTGPHMYISFIRKTRRMFWRSTSSNHSPWTKKPSNWPSRRQARCLSTTSSRRYE